MRKNNFPTKFIHSSVFISLPLTQWATRPRIVLPPRPNRRKPHPRPPKVKPRARRKPARRRIRKWASHHDRHHSSLTPVNHTGSYDLSVTRPQLWVSPFNFYISSFLLHYIFESYFEVTEQSEDVCPLMFRFVCIPPFISRLFWDIFSFLVSHFCKVKIVRKFSEMTEQNSENVCPLMFRFVCIPSFISNYSRTPLVRILQHECFASPSASHVISFVKNQFIRTNF